MPHRGVTDREHRAKLCSLYFRPWVLIRSHATTRVPHLEDLDLVLLPRWDTEGADLHAVIVRPRCSREQTLAPGQVWRKRSYDEAWRRYIRGNIVSEHAERIIRNFLLVMCGTGKNNDSSLGRVIAHAQTSVTQVVV